jgi:hypothetical protein
MLIPMTSGDHRLILSAISWFFKPTRYFVPSICSIFLLPSAGASKMSTFSSCRYLSTRSHGKDAGNIQSPICVFQVLESRPASPESDSPDEMIHGSSCHHSSVKVSSEQVAKCIS